MKESNSKFNANHLARRSIKLNDMQHLSDNPFSIICNQLNALASAVDKLNEQSTTRHTAPLPQLLTTDEVINMLHVCRSTLWNWERKKLLIPNRAGRRNLYKLEDILKLIGLPE